MSSQLDKQSQPSSLNDACRKGVPHQNCFITSGVLHLTGFTLPSLLYAVITFDNFNEDNDPYGEHDFGTFEYKGHKLFWKIDVYADDSLTLGAENPLSDESVRVITIMLADEY